MNRITRLGFCLTLILVASWLFSSSKTFSNEPNIKANNRHAPIVHKWDEELVTESGSLRDALLNTHLFIEGLFKYNILIKGDPNSFSQNKENLDTVITYLEGASNWANKVNASNEIKETLQKSLILTKTAVVKQDYDSLYEAEQLIHNLNNSYNSDK